MSSNRQAVVLPNFVAERLQLAADLYAKAHEVQTEWTGRDREEGERHYLDAAEHLKDAAREIMRAVDVLLMMHRFEDMDEAAEKEAAGEAAEAEGRPMSKRTCLPDVVLERVEMAFQVARVGKELREYTTNGDEAGELEPLCEKLEAGAASVMDSARELVVLCNFDSTDEDTTPKA